MSLPANPGATAASPLADPFEDPRWFAHGFDARRAEVGFVAADRASLASQTFLDWRWGRAGAAYRRENGAALIARLPKEKPAPAIIWHTAFCCSTLLAKALDLPGRNLSLCEPQILVYAAEAKRAGLLARAPLVSAPQLTFHLLSRGFASDERVTIKPAPAANTLLREAATQTSGPMLVLYSDCRSFLISVYKLGEQGRKYVRTAFIYLLGDERAETQWPMPKILALTDLELAAMVWHMQMAELLRAWPLLTPGRIASLDCDAFLETPVETLCRVDEFLSLGLGRQHLRKVVAGPLFRHNAKTGEEQFDTLRRKNEQDQIGRTIGPDLDRIVAQSYEICTTTPRAAPLPQPIVPTNKAYRRQASPY
jgi:hypothetical protein